MAVLTAPDRIRKPTTTTKARNTSFKTCGPHKYIARPAIRLSLYMGIAHGVRDNHHEKQRREPGKHEAVNRDDDRGTLQVLKLGMGKFTVYLSKRLFAAHGQNGVAEGDQNSEQAELSGEILTPGHVCFRKPRDSVAEFQVFRSRQRHGLIARLRSVIADQVSKITTITVVICMTFRAPFRWTP